MSSSADRADLGFSLVQVIVTLVVVCLIALVAVPSAAVFHDDAQVRQILETAERLHRGAVSHHKDTLRYAVEDSRYEAPGSRQLSRRQTAANWRGPYLDRPLGPDDNPSGGIVILHDNFQGDLAVPHARCFRITGPGSPPRRGPGQFVSFHDISEHLARLVDAALDHGVSGSWRRYGRVQWSAEGGGVLMIYLLG